MNSLALSLVLAASIAVSSCIHEEARPASAGVQVTQVNQVNVSYPTSVHVHQGPQVDCEAICRNIHRACRRGCAPTSWSPNNMSIRNACENDCRFNEFVCMGDCRRGRR